MQTTKVVCCALAIALGAGACFAKPTIQWQCSLGGSGYDDASSIQQTTDGGFIVAGESNSNDAMSADTMDRMITKKI